MLNTEDDCLLGAFRFCDVLQFLLEIVHREVRQRLLWECSIVDDRPCKVIFDCGHRPIQNRIVDVAVCNDGCCVVRNDIAIQSAKPLADFVLADLADACCRCSLWLVLALRRKHVFAIVAEYVHGVLDC